MNQPASGIAIATARLLHLQHKDTINQLLNWYLSRHVPERSLQKPADYKRSIPHKGAVGFFVQVMTGLVCLATRKRQSTRLTQQNLVSTSLHGVSAVGE